jgi:hypothetical protein
LLKTSKNQKAHAGRYSRYLTGTLGLEVVQTLVDHFQSGGSEPAAKGLARVRDVYRQLLPVVLQPGYQQIGDDELMNGRAGFLAGLLEIRSFYTNFRINLNLNTFFPHFKSQKYN